MVSLNPSQSNSVSSPSASSTNRSPNIAMNSMTTPLVQPNPVCTSYSPPPPAEPVSLALYCEKERLRSTELIQFCLFCWLFCFFYCYFVMHVTSTNKPMN